jgi:hypothetical protein
MRSLILLSLLPLCACTSARQEQDVGGLSQATYNAAASLPQSPQTQAIMANSVAIAGLVGQPISTVSTTAAPVTGGTP